MFRRILPLVLLAPLLAACEAAAPAAPGPEPSTSEVASSSPLPSPPFEVSVAFLEDLSPEGALERTLPSLQAVELALETASLPPQQPLAVELVQFDAKGSDATASEIATQIAGDPAYVAAIASPDLPGQAVISGILSEAGVPLLSLSARDTVADAAPGTWLRMVAPTRVQAEALARAAATLPASRRGICLVASPPDGTVYANVVRRSLRQVTAVIPVPDAAGVEKARCGIAVWTGGAERGAELATALGGTDGTGPVLVGGPGLRDPVFLELADGAAEGVVSLCSCADVSTSLDLAAQRFIQDYQSEFGSPPGPSSVEAWDLAHLLIRGLREGGRTRADLMAWVAALTGSEGLGGPYAFADGELADPASMVRRYRVAGGRWVATGGR